jgi:formate hydrogenlyase subunit 4
MSVEQFSELEFVWKRESTELTVLIVLFTSFSFFMKSLLSSGSEHGEIGVSGSFVSCVTDTFGTKFPLFTSSIAFLSYKKYLLINNFA